MSSIKELLLENKHTEIFEVVKTQFKENKEIRNDFFILETEYSRLQKRLRNGTIISEEYNVEINTISLKILNIIDSIDEVSTSNTNQIVHPPSFAEVVKLCSNFIEKDLEHALKFQEETNHSNQMIHDSAEVFTFDDADEEAINMTCAFLRKYTARRKVMQESLITLFENQEKEFDQLISRLKLITRYFDNLNPSYTSEELRGTKLIFGFLDIQIKTHKKNEQTVKSLEIQREQSKKQALLNLDTSIKKFKNEKIIKSLIDTKSITIDYFDTAKKYNPLNVTDINAVKEIKAELMLTLKEIENRIET